MYNTRKLRFDRGGRGVASWFPAFYDLIMSPLETLSFKQIRKELFQNLRGRVLEIGSGTGVNFSFYQKGMVERVDAIEPDERMIEKSEKRRRLSPVPIYLHQQSAEKIAFPDQTFDSVVATLVFCSIPDPLRALREVRRVSKPGAPVLLFEHVRMEQPFLGKAQDVLNPVWRRMTGGCQLNRDTLAVVKEAGLSVKRVKSYAKGLFLVIESVNE